MSIKVLIFGGVIVIVIVVVGLVVWGIQTLMKRDQ
jgi:hypothetical protein